MCWWLYTNVFVIDLYVNTLEVKYIHDCIHDCIYDCIHDCIHDCLLYFAYSPKFMYFTSSVFIYKSITHTTNHNHTYMIIYMIVFCIMHNPQNVCTSPLVYLYTNQSHIQPITIMYTIVYMIVFCIMHTPQNALTMSDLYIYTHIHTHTEEVSIVLETGLAEIFGSEIPRGEPMVLMKSKLAIYTWHGCTLTVKGVAKVAYVGETTPMKYVYMFLWSCVYVCVLCSLSKCVCANVCLALMHAECERSGEGRVCGRNDTYEVCICVFLELYICMCLCFVHLYM
jgi:hypothetical protein